MNYKADWGFEPMDEMQYKHCDFPPMDCIKDYYKRTGMIVITHWAYTKSEFEKIVTKIEKVIVDIKAGVYDYSYPTKRSKQETLERNQEYLHRLYTIKFKLDL